MGRTLLRFSTKVFVEAPELVTDTKLVQMDKKYYLILKRFAIYDFNVENAYQTPMFTSKKQSVVFVDENGIAYARSTGKTSITVDLHGEKKTVNVVVTE